MTPPKATISIYTRTAPAASKGHHDGSRRRSGNGPNSKIAGIGNLFIADASIFPSMITVSINWAVMIAAEMAADVILGQGGMRPI